ncbi:MAG: cobalamin B12-binding domain-containing protein [Deltaproteobacteria bacterium]|nr:cobalamin B12-binding domain-containing protein [Deltaproteobacteria bacterium]MBW1924425.1 cobalamin B12-binding domain-containing protein [Deltaproteobacteria bacterium]MBW1948263.1 cobalamin B12-binding domain-containing protein [Deltaproteobacteria bacterium]MBW2007839.1 cobalamin B12-binding domain-containing protein [Deltaproteobacteria bacterium]MBW2101733.1 cobalamin B12-binding domain-containing protein [Deltaproteobacteria bacterium]
MESKRIKVVISKVGLDGHDRGAKVVASLLREAGMEVVYLGMYQSPEGIVRAAVDEDADVIGVSYLSGEHLVFTPRIVEEMKKNGLEDVLFVVGGAFPPEDIPVMKEMGADEVFRGGSLTQSFVDYIREHVRR